MTPFGHFCRLYPSIRPPRLSRCNMIEPCFDQFVYDSYPSEYLYAARRLFRGQKPIFLRPNGTLYPSQPRSSVPGTFQYAIRSTHLMPRCHCHRGLQKDRRVKLTKDLDTRFRAGLTVTIAEVGSRYRTVRFNFTHLLKDAERSADRDRRALLLQKQLNIISRLCSRLTIMRC
jgi:hypothetical protein